MNRQEYSALAAHIHHLVSDQVNWEIEILSPAADDIFSGILNGVDEEGDPVDILANLTLDDPEQPIANPVSIGNITFPGSSGKRVPDV